MRSKDFIILWLILVIAISCNVVFVYGASITVDSPQALQGSVISIKGWGFTYTSGSQVEVGIYLDYKLVYSIKKFFLDDSGAFNIDVVVPAIPDGLYQLWAVNLGLNETARVNFRVGLVQLLASIDSISPSNIIQGDLVSFRGQGFSNIGSVSYSWVSSLDGFLSNQNSFTTRNLSVGSHIITLTVSDNIGNYRIAQSTIQVKSRPVAAIDSPRSLTVYRDEWLTFTAAGTDLDGRVTGYQWVIDDNIVSQAREFQTQLSVGIHVISLVVIDNDQLRSNPVTLTLEVKNSITDYIPYVVVIIIGGGFTGYVLKRIINSHDGKKTDDKNRKKKDRKPDVAFIEWSLSGLEITNKNSVKFSVNLTNIGNQKSSPLQINLWSTVGTKLAKSRLKIPEILPTCSYSEETSLSIDPSSGNGLFNIMAWLQGCLSDGHFKKHGVWIEKIGYVGLKSKSRKIVDYLEESGYHWGRIDNVENYIELLTYDILVIEGRLTSPKATNNLKIFAEMEKEYFVNPTLKDLKERLTRAPLDARVKFFRQ